jgi:predicted nucleic acid-binding protein
VEYFGGSDVYLDTDVLVNLAYTELPNSAACFQACQFLAESGSIVYLSVLSHTEFAQAFRILATRQHVAPHLIDEFDLRSWSKREVRERWLGYWYAEFQSIVASFPEAVHLPVGRAIVQQSVDVMARYALRSQDAIHLATALHYEIPVFWTCDKHFQRVDGIYVEVIREAA